MIAFIRSNWFGLLFLLVLTGLVVVGILKTDFVTVDGTVIEKSTTSTREGRIRYFIVIKSDDGFLEQEEGMHVCQYKVGDRIRYKTTRSKDLFE
jgi:hypothetical protein